MNLFVFVSTLFLLQIVCLIVGSKAMRSLKTQQDYFLGGRSIAFFPLMMTFVATQVGGGLVLGAAEEAYKYGWMVLLYPLGAILGLLLLACGIGRRMAEANVSTVAQLFESSFRSPGLKKIASLLSIISLFMILVAQIIASKKFMLSVGVDSALLFYLFWAIVIVYTALGGFKAVVSTDIVQATFFAVAFLLAIFYVYYSGTGFVDSVSAGEALDNFDVAKGKFCGWVLMPLLFMVIEQDMGQRCFAARSPKIVSMATAGAALVTLGLCTIPVYFGVMARRSGMSMTQGSSVFMNAVMAMTTPAIAGIVGCAVIAAIISTADSLINAISANISQDFDLSFLKGSKSVRTAQMLTGGIALLAMVFSLWFDNIVDLLIQSYDLSVSCLFVSVSTAIFKRHGNHLSAVLSIACGGTAFFAFKAFPAPLPSEICSVLISLSGYAVGELIASIQKQRLEEMSACIDENG